MSPEPRSLYRYRFATAEFDEARFELRVSGLVVEVQRKPLEILRLLLRRAGEIVTKQELLDEVWGGRLTVDNVVGNALVKLRTALGEQSADRVVTQARVGYRLTGAVERIAVGRNLISTLVLTVAQPVPRREHFLLERLIAQSHSSEVWTGRHAKTGERRVYKFSKDGEQLETLKREATLYRVLKDGLGESDAFVKVIDWNFEETPYFLECEYGGEDLIRWSDTPGQIAATSLAERLGLFQQIVDAVAAAHSVGVLHKDLKPNNVLIAPIPGGWQIRLTDFGSGRLLDPDRLAARGITELGLTMTQAVRGDTTSGTLLYLAPELLAGGTPTVQSDLYALGLMLYQLVVADLHKPMGSGWERTIDDELLREDIAAATDVSPAHRLSGAAELAERLRHLDARRAERRRQVAAATHARVAAAALERGRAVRPWIIAVTATLALGLAATSVLYYRELWTHRLLVASEAHVRIEARRAETVTQFLSENVLSSADPFIGDAQQTRTVKSALDDAAASLEGRFSGDPQTEASVRIALGTVYIRILESEAAVTQWRRVIELLTAAVPPTDVRLIESRYSLAQALALASHFDEAQHALVLADQARERVETTPGALALLSHRSWGVYYLNTQQCDRGIPHIEQAVAMLRQAHPPDTASLDLARILLGQCYTGVSRFKDSERVADDLIAEVQRRNNPSELTLALARYVLGESLAFQQRYHEAEPLLDAAYRVAHDVLGEGNFRTLAILNVQCSLYADSNQNEAALSCLQEAYRETRQRHGDDHWTTFGILANMGIEQFYLKHYHEAVESLTTAHQGLDRTLGHDKALTLFSGYYLARSLLKRGDAVDAAVLYAELTPQGLAGAEPGAPWALRLSLLHGLILAQQKHRADALGLLRPAMHLTVADDPNESIISESQSTLRQIEAAAR